MTHDSPPELHDRLRAANPVPDLDEIRVSPWAAPAAEPARPSRGPRRTLAGVGAAALAATVLALTGVIGGDRTPRTLDVAQAAERALDPGDRILHIKTRIDQRSTGLADRSSTMDVWLAPNASAGRVRGNALDGTLLYDDILRPAPPKAGARERPAGRAARRGFDLVSDARAQLDDGTLRSSGTVTVDGRRFERFRNASEDVTWDFDAETLQPTRTTYEPRFARGGRFVAVTTVLEYERLADTEANRGLLKPPRIVTPRPRVVTPGGDAGPAIVERDPKP